MYLITSGPHIHVKSEITNVTLHKESLTFTKYMWKKKSPISILTFVVWRFLFIKITKWEKEKWNVVLFARYLVKAAYQADLGPLNHGSADWIFKVFSGYSFERNCGASLFARGLNIIMKRRNKLTPIKT